MTWERCGYQDLLGRLAPAMTVRCDLCGQVEVTFAAEYFHLMEAGWRVIPMSDCVVFDECPGCRGEAFV